MIVNESHIGKTCCSRQYIILILPDLFYFAAIFLSLCVLYYTQIYDCDFIQQLGYAVGVDSIHRGGKTVFDIESLDDLRDVRIRTDNHCFGCTAGMGSS